MRRDWDLIRRMLLEVRENERWWFKKGMKPGWYVELAKDYPPDVLDDHFEFLVKESLVVLEGRPSVSCQDMTGKKWEEEQSGYGLTESGRVVVSAI